MWETVGKTSNVTLGAEIAKQTVHAAQNLLPPLSCSGG